MPTPRHHLGPARAARLPLGAALKLLKLWPGLAALLSLLAIWGLQLPRPESPRPAFSAGQSALPELRAALPPAPGPLLLDTPPPPPKAHRERWGVDAARSGGPQRAAPAPDLHALGRQQTDGA